MQCLACTVHGMSLDATQKGFAAIEHAFLRMFTDVHDMFCWMLLRYLARTGTKKQCWAGLCPRLAHVANY